MASNKENWEGGNDPLQFDPIQYDPLEMVGFD